MIDEEESDQWVHQKSPDNHWWNPIAAYTADFQRFYCFIHNCECMFGRELEVWVLKGPGKQELYWEYNESQANQVRQVAQQTETS